MLSLYGGISQFGASYPRPPSPPSSPILDVANLTTTVLMAIDGWQERLRFILHERVLRLLEVSHVSPTVVFIGLYYLRRIFDKGLGAECSSEEKFAAALSLALKYHEDVSYGNKYWAEFIGLPVTRFNEVERTLLALLKYNINVSPLEYSRWMEQLSRCACPSFVPYPYSYPYSDLTFNYPTYQLNSNPSFVAQAPIIPYGIMHNPYMYPPQQQGYVPSQIPEFQHSMEMPVFNNSYPPLVSAPVPVTFPNPVPVSAPFPVVPIPLSAPVPVTAPIPIPAPVPVVTPPISQSSSLSSTESTSAVRYPTYAAAVLAEVPVTNVNTTPRHPVTNQRTRSRYSFAW